MRAILAGLRRVDQSHVGLRRLLAAAAFVALLGALTVVAAPLALLVLGLGGVLLLAVALYGADQPRLRDFCLLNAAAVVLLAWAATERAELVVERAGDEVTVALHGVRLTARLADLEGGERRLALALSAVDERPMAAPWIYENLPPLAGVGAWLEGGMRGGVEDLRVVDAAGAPLVDPLQGVWQPDAAQGPPLVIGALGGWEVRRADDGSVELLGPPVSGDQLQVVAPLARPAGTVRIALEGVADTPAVEVIASPDRRLLEIAVRAGDGPPETLVGGPFVYRRGEIGWTQALLREVGRAWLVALALLAAARAVAVTDRSWLPRLPPPVADAALASGAVLFALITLGLSGLVAVLVLDGIPHTVESIAYLFQAQIFALGGLWAPAPPVPEAFEQAYIVVHEGRWFGVLPPGQSVMLAAGLLAGAVWLVSPLLSALAVGLTVLLGRLTYGWLAGLLAGLLLAPSPLVVLLSGDMLAHPAGLFWSVVAAIGVALALRWRPGPGWLLAGLGTGGLVMTRPLAALGVGVPLTLYLLWTCRVELLPVLLRRAGLWMLGAAPGVLFMAYVNVGLTGSPFMPALSLWSEVDRLGFGPNVGTRGGHDLASALGNTWANTAVLSRHLFGWPSYLTFAPALVPYVLGARSRWDRVFLLWAGGLTAAHLLYWSDGIVYGPRFAFEAVAALALLTARGIALLARADGLVPAERGAAARPVAARVAADAAPAAENGAHAAHSAPVYSDAAPVSRAGVSVPLESPASPSEPGVRPAPEAGTEAGIPELPTVAAEGPDGGRAAPSADAAAERDPEVGSAGSGPAATSAGCDSENSPARARAEGVPAGRGFEGAPARQPALAGPPPIRGGSGLPSRLSDCPDAPALTAAPLVSLLVALLVAVNLVGYLPDLVLAYRDYNSISRARLALVEEVGLENALVFVTSEWPDWQSYAQVFPANGPLLDGPVIYARDLGEAENARLMARYPDRRAWLLRDLQLTEIRR